MAMDRLLSAFNQSYYQPQPNIDILVARLFVCFLFAWKLLSRNFDFYGFVPSDVALFPSQVYSAESIKLWTGNWFTTDILTFHFIHYVIPYFGPSTLSAIQFFALLFVIAYAFVGDRFGKWLAISVYILLIYLWGYIFRMGQEVDAISLYFGMLLTLIVSPSRSPALWQVNRSNVSLHTETDGVTKSNLILVFVFYYFGSGLNKITDISPAGWLDYDLVSAIQLAVLQAEHSTQHIPEFFHHVLPLGDFGKLFPVIVYASHLMIPLCFFYRGALFGSFLFYAAFHIMTFGVGISFTAYIFVWACILPAHKMFSFRANPKLES